MDELDVVREFIASSDFSESVKKALNEFLALEFKSGTQSEYLAVIQKYAKVESDEN
jgi:hypothetical protein